MLKGQTSVASAAKAIKDHIVDWRKGSQGEYRSMGVILEKAVYGLQPGICMSLPVICEGDYQVRIVEDLELSAYQREKIKEAEQDLLMEQSLLDHV
jgi:malate/lactate dehydrogenase